MWSRARRLPADAEIQPFQWIGRDEATHLAEVAARRYEVEHPASFDEAALRAEIATLEKEAFAKGYAHGEREGNAVAAQRAEVLLTRLSQTIDDLAALRSGLLHRTERDVVRIAVAIAERIVHRTLAVDPELLLAMARVAIDRLGDGIVATIHLHPEDHRAMVAVRAKRPDVVPSAVSMEPDATVARGGCVVRSAFGVIDLGLDAQIAEVSRALLGEDRAELDKTA
jgi:flagellar assembly protein FliH